MHTIARILPVAIAIILFTFAVLRQTACGAQVPSKASVAADTTFSWTRATASAPWAARSAHATVVFHEKLWVIGGWGGTGSVFNDVWSSADGVNWRQETANAPWPARYGHQAVVFGNRVLIAGGGNEHTSFNDAWSSSDGVAWQEVTASAAWTPRFGPSMVVLGSNIWLAGGGAYNVWGQIWFSSDGAQWVLGGDHLPALTRFFFAASMFNGKIWVLGGESSMPLNDSWFSPDGVNWTQATANAQWHARLGHVAVAFANRLWVLGGTYWIGSGPGQSDIILNDVWNSADGAQWIRTPAAPWTPRSSHSGLVFNDKLWILGGVTRDAFDNPIPLNDIWYMAPVSLSVSTNGGPWYQIGQPLDLRLAVTGISGPISYQWTKNGTAISSATGNTFEIDELDLSDAGSYSCQIRDQYNEAFSSDAVKIQVFPAGSLPMGTFVGVAAVVALAIAAVLKMTKRYQNDEK